MNNTVSSQTLRPPVTSIISTSNGSTQDRQKTVAEASRTASSRLIAGVLPLVISNDADFVAETLRQRDTLEVVRAAKAMLYDAYMKVVMEQEQRS
jgi:hypothetical protein